MSSASVISLFGTALLVPVIAAAQSGAPANLSQSLQALRAAGYSGLESTEVPAPAASPAYTAANSPQDDWAGLIQAAEARPETTGNINETARALGFQFQGDFSDRSLERQTDADGFHIFSVAKLGSREVIVIDVYSRATKELHSFRISSTGTLEAAVMTKKSNGAFHAEPITLPNASYTAELTTEIAFWTEYYRSHLKS